MRRTTLAALAASSALAIVLAGCSSSGGTDPGTGGGSALPKAPDNIAMQQTLGSGEGALNLVAWAGYAEDGTNDKDVDWVTPFEESTGCDVNVKIGGTSDEMVKLMKTGQYDGVSASGDATLRLIYSGDVAPVNTALVPNYKTITDFLKDRSWNSADGQMYGIPHGWGANLLMSRSDVVTPAPDSWAAVFDPNSPYKGKITAYDSPIYIADAALYLKATKPELKINNPYELDDAQFTAAVDLLKQQHALIGEYWSDYIKAISAFESGDSVIGTSWQVIANLIDSGGKAKVNAIVPKEGSTGWSDTWMVAAKAKHPNCMYKWMDWITSATVNAQVAEWFGEAPAQTLACAETADKKHCEIFHATDADYAEQISYWTTPTRNCGDSRGAVCKDYAAWTQAWTEIKG
ncbi:MAG TPA: ABC transporter substrate-binding protein [Kineosporiaceae bacterium]|nr:ABC transporter substrate-binding protein [Kineosporiaceae bacterium]